MRSGHARKRARRSGVHQATILFGFAGSLVFAAVGTAAAQGFETCPEEMEPGLTGLAGVVRDSAGGVIIPGARVLGVWDEPDGERRTRSTETDERGAYLLCSLPPSQRLALQATFASFATSPVLVTVEPGPPAGLDFILAVDAPALVNPFTVPGRLVGRVLDRSTGRPIEAASLALSGEDQQRFSDGSGRYAFGDLEPGVYRVVVEHLAFENVDQLINVPSDRTLEVNFELSVDPIELEPLVVTAIREKRLELQGYYERRDLGKAIGAGVFLTREDIKKAGATRVTHYLGRIPGLRTQCTGSGNNNCVIRMTRGAPSLSRRAEFGCMNANVYVDGVRVIRDGGLVDSIDNFVTPSEIAGIEIYRGPSELPAEFGGSVGRCGAIVIWTGPATPGS